MNVLIYSESLLTFLHSLASYLPFHLHISKLVYYMLHSGAFERAAFLLIFLETIIGHLQNEIMSPAMTLPVFIGYDVCMRGSWSRDHQLF